MQDYDKTLGEIKSTVLKKIYGASPYAYIDTTFEKTIDFQVCRAFVKVVKTPEISDIILNLQGCNLVKEQYSTFYKVPKQFFKVKYYRDGVVKAGRTNYYLDLESVDSICIHDYYDDGCLFLFRYIDYSNSSQVDWVCVYLQTRIKTPTSFKDVYFNYR